MPPVDWFEIRGFEGRYVMTADGMRVHSLPRRFRFGEILRITKGKEMHRSKQGFFQLRVEGGQKRLYPHELLSLIGKKKEGLNW